MIIDMKEDLKNKSAIKKAVVQHASLLIDE